MKKIISVFLAAVVCASMFAVPGFGAFAEETSSAPDLDDLEQRLAYELSFVQGELSRERVVYLTSHKATITLSSGGTVTGEVSAKGLADTVTSLRFFLYIQRYESGKWKTVDNNTTLVSGYEGEASIVCSDSTKIISGYDYRISYTVYAYRYNTYQSFTGNSSTVHY